MSSLPTTSSIEPSPSAATTGSKVLNAALAVQGVSHRYGQRLALDDVSLDVAPGEIFALLGPNGGGKTTLFRILSTLVPITTGRVMVLGSDLRNDPDRVRQDIGVVFQAPSLDKKLTVGENLRCQGHLYGLRGAELARRIGELIERFGLSGRERERCETLSGGLRRRVELAKGLLHRPRLLLLDEPSTGLDPGARHDVWQYLEYLRRELGVTVVLTTHLLEEADRADRLAILHRGQVVAIDTPDRLRSTIGGDTITIETADPARVEARITAEFALPVRRVGDSLRLEVPDGHAWVSRLAQALAGDLRSITLGKPTLEDVFIARTGHRFHDPREEPARG